jgi:hypothetical protein
MEINPNGLKSINLKASRLRWQLSPYCLGENTPTLANINDVKIYPVLTNQLATLPRITISCKERLLNEQKSK